MNIRAVDLNLLSVFDALFDERSVTRAADRLAVTQPTVSGMLRRLRQTFSDELFVRTSHGIVPTPRAEALAGPVKDLLADALALVEPEMFDPANAETTFKLCGSDYMQSAIISPLIAALRQRSPKARVSIIPRLASGVADLLARGDIDICISSREAAVPDLPARLLCRDRYVCVARMQHPLSTKRLSLEQLCAFDHVLVAPTGGSFAGPVDNVLGAMGHRRNVAVTVPSFPILFDVLRSDDFLAFIPERLLRTQPAGLKKFETEVAPPVIDVIANWHPRVGNDPRHKWLRALFVEIGTSAAETPGAERN